MSRKTIIAAALLAVLCAAGIAAWLIMRGLSVTNPAAEILVDGKVIRTVPLDTELSFRLECGGGYNVIEVKKGTVRMTEADCPDKVCVNTGAISGGVVPIICLPHKLEIRIVSGGEPEADAAVY